MGNPADGGNDAGPDKARAAGDCRFSAAKVRRESDGLLRRVARGLAEMPAGTRPPPQIQPLRTVRTPRRAQGRSARRSGIPRGRRKGTSLAKPSAVRTTPLPAERAGPRDCATLIWREFLRDLMRWEVLPPTYRNLAGIWANFRDVGGAASCAVQPLTDLGIV